MLCFYLLKILIFIARDAIVGIFRATLTMMVMMMITMMMIMVIIILMVMIEVCYVCDDFHIACEVVLVMLRNVVFNNKKCCA